MYVRLNFNFDFFKASTLNLPNPAAAPDSTSTLPLPSIGNQKALRNVRRRKYTEWRFLSGTRTSKTPSQDPKVQGDSTAKRADVTGRRDGRGAQAWRIRRCAQPLDQRGADRLRYGISRSGAESVVPDARPGSELPNQRVSEICCTPSHQTFRQSQKYVLPGK
jgi:hypothetical protein